MVNAGLQQILVYPHVDSCMTVTVVTAKGLVGGHVSMQGFGEMPDPGGAIVSFCEMMKDMINGEIMKVMFVGTNLKKSEEGGMAHYTLGAALEALGANTNKKLDSFVSINTRNVMKAIDIFVDLGSHTLAIQKSDESRSRKPLEAPALWGDVLWSKDYTQLSGKYLLYGDGKISKIS
jgi:hypothetical protein